MKRIALLLSILLATAAIWANPMTLSNPGIGINLYDSAGKLAQSDSPMDNNWILTTLPGESAVLVSATETVTVEGDSVMSIGNAEDGTPYLFLISGCMTVRHSSFGSKLLVYTPVRMYSLDGACTITVISDASAEDVEITSGTAAYYDSLRGQSQQLVYTEITEVSIEPSPQETEIIPPQADEVLPPEEEAGQEPVVTEPVPAVAVYEEPQEEKQKTTLSFGLLAAAQVADSFHTFGPYVAAPYAQIGKFVIAPQLAFKLEDFADAEALRNLLSIDTAHGVVKLLESVTKYIGQISYGKPGQGFAAGISKRCDFTFSNPVALGINHEYDGYDKTSFFATLDSKYVDAKLYIDDIDFSEAWEANPQMLVAEIQGNIGPAFAGGALNIRLRELVDENFLDFATNYNADLYPALFAGVNLGNFKLEAFAAMNGFDFAKLTSSFTAGASASFDGEFFGIKLGASYGKDQQLYNFLGNQKTLMPVTGIGKDVLDIIGSVRISDEHSCITIDTAVPLCFDGGCQLVCTAPNQSLDVSTMELSINIGNFLSIGSGLQTVGLAGKANGIVQAIMNADMSAISDKFASLADPATSQLYARADIKIGKIVDIYAKVAGSGQTTLGARLSFGNADSSMVAF